MVRHITTADEESTSTTRRTRSDLRYLADVVTHTRVDTDVATDASRNSRLIDHGWVTSQGRSTTANGHRIAGVVETLRNEDVETDDFDMVVDIMGMSDFVDACIEAPSIQDAVAFIRGALVLVNQIDEARHAADRGHHEYEHDGLFAPHFADFEARLGTIEVRFETRQTAFQFANEYVSERYDVESKHDERFKGNRNPKRRVVQVVEY